MFHVSVIRLQGRSSFQLQIYYYFKFYSLSLTTRLIVITHIDVEPLWSLVVNPLEQKRACMHPPY
jgi:hypothetical protein